MVLLLIGRLTDGWSVKISQKGAGIFSIAIVLLLDQNFWITHTHTYIDIYKYVHIYVYSLYVLNTPLTKRGGVAGIYKMIPS